METPKCIAAANRIIERTKEHNRYKYSKGLPMVHISTRRVQRILYLCQLIYFMKYDDSNMIPEEFCTFGSGPVIFELYDYWDVHQVKGVHINSLPNLETYKLNNGETHLINKVVDYTINISTDALEDYVTKEGSPWDIAHSKNPKHVTDISKESMKRYIRNIENQRELVEFIKRENSKHKTGFTR